MRRLISLLLLLIPTILLSQASWHVVTVPYRADNLNFFTGNGSTFFNVTLTGNVNTSGLNGGSDGMEAIFNICQDNVGGRTFNWPPNVVSPPTINSGANQCTVTRFVNTGNFTWANTGIGTGISTTFPGGSPIQTQVNNSGVFGGTPCETFNTLNAGPANVNCDWHSKGPNPWVDISSPAFGARIFPNPAQSTTATCNGTTSVTLAAAIDFIKGDGIVLHKCGPATALSTPAAPSSVTPQGILNGVTTRCYEVVAEDFSLGMTAASPSTCTNTAASTFGSVNATITNVTASSQGPASAILTVTTSANHNFQAGWLVKLTSLAGAIGSASANGVYYIQTTPSGTTFTVREVGAIAVSGFGLMPTTVATSGTASGSAHIFVNWAGPNTGVMRYWVYRQDGGAGSFNLVGVAQGIEPFYDDYGWTAPTVTNVPEVPLTAPASAANQALATSITAGAGTTSITVANAASNTISGISALHDDTVAFIAATNSIINNAAEQSGTVFVPAPGVTASSILFNFPLVIPNHSFSITFNLNGGIIANQPIVPNSFENWFGVSSGGVGPGSFSTRAYASVTGAGYPQWLNPGHSTIDVEGIQFDGGQPQQWAAISDMGSNQEPATITFRHDGFQAQNNSGGVGLTLRGFSFSFTLDDIYVSMFGSVPAPIYAAAGVRITTSGQFASVGTPGIATLKNSSISGSGIQIDANSTNQTGTIGSPWTFDNIFSENTCAPFIQFNNINSSWSDWTVNNLTVADAGCGQAASVDLCSPNVRTLTGLRLGLNTANTACLDNSGATTPSVKGITLSGGNTFASLPTSGVTTGLVNLSGAGTVNDSIGNSRFVPAIGTGGYFHVNQPNGGILLDNQTPPTPTSVVAGGGSVPVGTFVYVVSVVDANGGESTTGPTSNTVTTSGGNQTVNSTWTTVTYPIQGYNIYRSNGGGFGRLNLAGPCCLNGTYSDSAASTSGIVASTSTAFGLSGISTVGGVFSNLFNVFGGNFKSSNTGTFTANRNVLWPDASGMIAVSSFLNSSYDNFNRANGGLGSNWTTLQNSLSISTNTVTGGTGATQNTSFWTPTTYAPDQFAQVTWTGGTNNGVGVVLRSFLTGGNANSYLCFEGTANFFIQKVTNGGAPVTLTSPAITGASGDVVRCEMSGTTITGFQNGVQRAQTTDSSFTTGQPGLLVFGNGSAAADNWSGGNLHPIAQLDTEQDWTQPQHFTQPVTIGATNPVAGALSSNTLYVSNIISNTGIAVLTGTGACATFSGQVGGQLAGSAACASATAASTLTIGSLPTAAHGYVCSVQDETTRANLFQQTSHSTTSCTLTITSVTQNDVFVFTAIGF